MVRGVVRQIAEYFVFEACEYKRHFLAYEPDYAIMTNIDFDHPDYFKDLADVMDAFGEMALRVKKALIACGDDSTCKKFRQMFQYSIMDLKNRMILLRKTLLKQWKVRPLMFL